MPDTIIIALMLVMSIALGWSIGANDAANSLGTAVGSRVISLRQAILLIAVCGFLGAYLQGQYVTKTIGKGIVQLCDLEQAEATRIALVAIFSGCVWVVLATWWKMPVSTSHSIVGAVAGAGLAARVPVDWRILRDIFICWIATPAGAALLGYVLLRFFQWLFPKIVPERFSRPVLTALVVVSGCYVAYSWGANDVANATGLISGAKVMSPLASVVLGGLAIVLGIVTWGYKVIDTVGTKITHLLPIMAFAAQFASAINVNVYTLFGIPVSTSHSIVGAIFGVGLVRGIRVVNLAIMKEILICWLATPLVSGVVSYAVYTGAAWIIR